MSTPTVSVVMSIYNGQRYLREAAESILNQTFADFEFIIVDDGSTDRTTAILDGYDDDRIVRVRNNVNIGLTKSLNKGLILARGKYIARHDADDVSFPHRLQTQVCFLDSNSDVALVSANFERIDATGRLLDRTHLDAPAELIPWRLLFHNCLGGHGLVMFRRDVVLELGGYDERYRFSQDYELWSRLAREHRIHILPDVLLQWRDHEASCSASYAITQEDLALEIVMRNLGWIPGAECISEENARRLHAFWTGRYTKVGDAAELYVGLQRIAIGFLSTLPPLKRYWLTLKVVSTVRRQFWYLSRYYGWRSAQGRLALWYSISWRPG